MTARQAVRTYLEMHDAAELRARRRPRLTPIVERMEQCPPALWRHLYTEVGREYHWVDRLAWTDEEIAALPRRPGARALDLRVQGRAGRLLRAAPP